MSQDPFREFDEDFRRLQRTLFLGLGVALVVGVVVLGFVGWVVVKLLDHFGVL